MGLRKQLIALSLATVTSLSIVNINANAQNLAGWSSSNGYWHYYENSKPVTGWKSVKGNWYYMNSQGAMLTGWQIINGHWYYLNSSGAMATGWIKLNNSWYYLNPNGSMATGFKTLGSSIYYLSSSGAMVTGDVTIENKTYHFNSSGAMTGSSENTNTTTNNLKGWIHSGGHSYYYENGKKITGWKFIDNNWYYMNNEGTMLTGWQAISGHWYYLNSNGAMATGLKTIGNSTYYLNSSGAMVTGDVTIGDKIYHFNSSGAMTGSSEKTNNDNKQNASSNNDSNGWTSSDGYWHYYENGKKVIGWKLIDNNWYYMNNQGNMLKEWQSIGGNWYYLGTNGIMVKGLKNIDNKWYYFNKSGVMLGRKFTAIVTANELNIRDNDNLNSNIMGKLYKGNVVMINLDSLKDGSWYSIDFGSKIGYVSSNYIRIDENLFNSLVSDRLIDFVKSYEGFSSEPYRGADFQNLTLGYGTTDKCSANWLFNYVPVTKELASEALKEEINGMAKRIKANLDSRGVVLKQNQFDSLCSFAYNCGVQALFSSSLYNRICDGVRDNSLKENFTAWCNCDGIKLQGLYNRRIEEFEMFMGGDYVRDL